MSDDVRRLQVKALCRATLDRPPSERAAFLAAAAGSDDTLRRDVEALLDSHGSEATFAPDEHVGPYRIIAMLGAGGMGEVFRARDSKLHRDVALKLLPRAFQVDPDRLARFRREAHVLASLNHPHIAAIYGLEESSGRHALVLELVEGVTLADRIAEGPVALVEALTIARQMADALQAAHEKGIIHRDVKPANVKVTPTGVVKVLDFGLAKTAGSDVQLTGASQAPTMAGDTEVGVVLGTAAYMSPEQARGREVDSRTDVWAFGCVLFEMLAGRKAFAAHSASDSITKILEGEPEWSQLPKSTPATIQQLLRQCLQKDPRNRLQTIAQARVATEQALAPRASLSRPWAAIVIAAIVAAVAAAYAWLGVDRMRPPASRADWVQLTNLDSAAQPALSPDGRMLAFIRGSSPLDSPGELYVKLLPDGEPVALTNDGRIKMSPVFSPDGSRIAYTVNESSWDTWEVPTLRGAARRWLPNASGLTWTGANGLLFSEIKTGSRMAIVRSNHSRSESRDLYVPPTAHGMAHRSYVSPDRKWVLVVEMDDNGAWLPCRLLPLDGGASRPVGPSGARCTDAAWSPDGRWMYFSADAGDGFHVWRQRLPDGGPEQVTSGPTQEQGLAMASDGRSLITSVGLMTQRSVWLRDASGERQISLEGYAFWPLLSADGRKVLFRLTSGVGSGRSPSELWMVELDSGHKQRLFPGHLITGYDVSHDDRVVAAVVEPAGGRTRLWLTWMDGREPPSPIPEAHGDTPRLGRHGDIVFRVLEGEAQYLYRIREDGTGRKRIARVPPTARGSASVFGTVSPDGEWLSGVERVVAADLVPHNALTQQLLYSISGQASRPLFRGRTSRLRWSHDGRHAYLSIQDSGPTAFAVGRTYVLPLASGSVLPSVPPGGFQSEADIAAIPGVVVLPHGDLAPGPSPSVYAFSRVKATSNLYRIPLQ